jgi:hypothetical protein
MPDAGVQAIREGKIDDAKLAAKINCRFGTPVGQVVQAAAAAVCKHQGNGPFWQFKLACKIFGLHRSSR